MATGKVPHYNRRTPRGRQGRAQAHASLQPRRLGTGLRPTRPGRAARGGGHDPSPTSCRCVTDAAMVSPFTFYRGGADDRRPTWRRSAPVSTSSCAATRTCRTSVSTPHPSAPCSSTSTTSTRRSRGPSNTTWPAVREFRGRGPRQRLLRCRRTGIATRSVASYREAMADFAQMHALDVWYSRLDAEEAVARGIAGAKKHQQKIASKAEKALAKSKDEGQRPSPLEADRGARRTASDHRAIPP